VVLGGRSVELGKYGAIGGRRAAGALKAIDRVRDSWGKGRRMRKSTDSLWKDGTCGNILHHSHRSIQTQGGKATSPPASGRLKKSSHREVCGGRLRGGNAEDERSKTTLKLHGDRASLEESSFAGVQVAPRLARGFGDVLNYP